MRNYAEQVFNPLHQGPKILHHPFTPSITAVRALEELHSSHDSSPPDSSHASGAEVLRIISETKPNIKQTILLMENIYNISLNMLW